MFMLIGTPLETPRYYNFGGFDNKTGILTIKSTQKSCLFFEVKTDFDYFDIDGMLFWEQFKQYRTIGLKKGFREVESAPLVRSSYHAEKHIKFKG